MLRLCKKRRFRFVLVVTLALAPTAALAASTPARLAGTWRRLPASPIVVDAGSASSVWTGRKMLVFGVATSRAKDGAILKSVNVAAAYDPTANTWHRLPSAGRAGTFPPYHSVWTGKEMLVWGQGTREAFNPLTNRWRQLPRSPLLSIHEGHGIVVWSGREMIGWGGGCCGDAFSDGVAYNPATNRWRALPRTPLAGSQHPVGAWTGRELVILVGNLDPDGKPWPARLARAAAYNPTTDTWHRLAPPPATGGTAVWDGREVLVVGAGPHARSALAYDPAANRWRRLPPTASGRAGAVAVWTGSRLLVWGGQSGRLGTPLRDGLAYDPKLNRWSSLSQAPVPGRLAASAVWTGRAMIVWGGVGPNASGKGVPAVASFAPSAR